MGACQCNEILRDDRQINTELRRQSMDYAATKENFLPLLKYQETEKDKDNFEFKIKEEPQNLYDSASVHSAVSAKIMIKSEINPKVEVVLPQSKDSPRSYIKEAEDLVITRAEQKFFKRSSTFEMKEVNNDPNLDYFDYSYKMFELFNDIRSNPENYKEFTHPDLEHIMQSLTKNKGDHVLFSETELDSLFNFMNSLSDKKISTAEVEFFVKESLKRKYEGKEMEILILSHYIHDNENVLSELLLANLDSASKALLQHYSIGFICTVPLELNEKRVFLCLAKIN